MSLSCSQCLTPIPVDPATGRLPPWCPKCGTDPKAFTRQATSALDVLREASRSRPAEAGRGAGGPTGGRNGWQSPVILADVPSEDLEAMAAPPRRLPPLGVGILLFAIACLVGSAYWASSSIEKVTNYARAEATVTDLVISRRSARRAASVFPVVAYHVNGSRYQFESSYAMSFKSYQRGDKVQALYPPGKPGAGVIDSFDSLWAGPMLPGLPGLALLGVWLCVHFGVGSRKATPALLSAPAR